MIPLNITAKDAATGPVLEVTGNLDFEHANALHQQIERLTLRRGQRLVIDLSGMEFCDSSGIAVLIAARRHAVAAEADLALVAVPANTLRVMAIVGLDQVFTFHPDTATATGV
ncbi:STAS domain-containing protein [Streptomyces sp. NPDC051320]|uniref:STAS domain-containing protein n=1 Tax=Streptomyces sp. NPDC051320 TaxID=3154644 RepID=UPI0034476EDC